MKSKDIALSAISAAFVAIALTLGSYFEAIDVFMLAVSTVVLMLPLYRKSYLGSFLAYLVGGALAFLLSGMVIQKFIYMAYFTFAGAYPVVNALFKKIKLNVWVGEIIKCLWCIGAFYFVYWICVYVFGIDPGYLWGISKTNIWYILVAFAIVFYVIFNYCVNMMQAFIDKYLARIIK